jgi:recombination protein RecR
MNTLPASLQKVALFLERLPGIGQKTANRLAFYFLRLPDSDLKEFADSVATLKTKTKLCKNCFNLTEEELCGICSDTRRDQSIITVVEDVLDLLSFETGDIYQGVYHVLHGKIDPLNHVGPNDIYIDQLIDRLHTRLTKKESIKEIILATNPDMEGEATAMYIKKKVIELQQTNKVDFAITRLGYGLPMGANLEYADYMTLKKALENRNKF